MRVLLVSATVLALAACGGGEKPATDAAATAAPTPGALTMPVTLTPCATCKVIPVTMTSNDKGNFFTPNKFEAREGDIIRFTVDVGVHNANFLPDSNPGRQGLPPASPLLQLPGQTHDVAMDFGTGEFYFQCDPHAALGMRGHVTVVKK